MSKTFIEIKNLSKNYGGLTLLENISFKINHGEKTALVGKNGCGKSTLLKIIKGLEEADVGTVKIAPCSAKIGYLPQLVEFEEETVFEVLQNAADESGLREYWESKIEVERAVFQAGLEGLDKKSLITNLSGGEKTRLYLAKLLIFKPDFLLLDEPTNFLDIKGLNWIEEFVKTREQGILMVSHDRYFLDKTVNRIIEIEGEKVSEYIGNYSSYRKEKSERLEKQVKIHRHQKEDIKRLKNQILRHKQIQCSINNSSVNDFVRAASKVHSRAAKALGSRVERIEKSMVQKPRKDYMVNIRFEGSGSSKIIANAENLKKSYGNRLLYEGVNFTISAGEKVGILGENGTGKTTLLRILQGLEKADSGKTFLKTEKTGYFSQIFDEMNPENTVIEEITAKTGLDIPEARNILANFLFTRESVFKNVGNLSIGEKSRLALSCIKSLEPEVLILDEPTCHLDVDTTEILEKVLKEYSGTIIIIAHDRFLLDNLVNRVLVIENQKIIDYHGNYSYYTDKKKSGNNGNEPNINNLLLMELKIAEISGKLSLGGLTDEEKSKLYEDLANLKNKINDLSNEQDYYGLNLEHE